MSWLKARASFVTDSKLHFEEKDLGDKKRIDLMVDGKKESGAFIMKGEKTNTSQNELQEALLLNYCVKNHVVV